VRYAAAAAGVLVSWLTCSSALAAADAGLVRHDRSKRDNDPLGWYVPDFAKLQTGGYSGLLTLGVGYAAFDDVFNWTLYYGYVPKFHAGRTVHSVSTTLSVRPFELGLGDVRLVPVYVGAGLLFGFGEGYFLEVPERYDPYSSSYYRPTGVHWMAHIGLELDWLPDPNDFFERHGLYAELRTLDTYFFSYTENRGELGPEDALATALGYRAAW
jgi:hypothetical protein